MGIDPRSLGVVVLTSSAFAGRGHEDLAEAAVDGGATAVHLRAPELDDQDLLPIALRVAARTRRAGIPLVVNDRPDVARVCGAGLHVGQDLPIAGVRRRIGADRILGVSVGDADEARIAEAAGADYLGVTVWPTATKPEAVAHGLEGLREIVAAVSLPVVGIGGIDPGNVGEVLATGAAGVAVISAVAAADDPVAAVRELRRAVDAARATGGSA
jgi:thiamine-phosphate pyrophosphorylase